MNIVKYLNGVGVPAFFTAEGCATAFAAMLGPSLGAQDSDRAHAATRGRTLNEAEALALFVLPRGQGVVAADGLVVLASNLAAS
jgi:hypothetical protein